MRKAFTLIELLVVIAIIAILAAILFPVFAQAKLAAKKSSGISNTKQTVLSFMIYTADYDDIMPNAFSRRASGTLRFLTIHPAPNGAVGSGWDTPIVQAEVASVWHQATEPYRKNWQMVNATGQEVVAGAFDTCCWSILPGAPAPADIGLAYNSFLHNYNSTAVEQSPLVPMLWSWTSIAMRGREVANPVLLCGFTWTGDCRFNAGGAAGDPANGFGVEGALASASGLFPSLRVWTYGKKTGGDLFGYVDGHAKFVRVATVKAPNFHLTAETDPWANWDGEGQDALGSEWTSQNNDCKNMTFGTREYSCFFRPDRTR